MMIMNHDDGAFPNNVGNTEDNATGTMMMMVWMMMMMIRMWAPTGTGM